MSIQSQLRTLDSTQSLPHFLSKPSLITTNKSGTVLVRTQKPLCRKLTNRKNVRFSVRASSGSKETELASLEAGSLKETIKVKGTVTAYEDIGLNVADELKDKFTDFRGRSMLVELVSTELDTDTGLEKPTVKDYAQKVGSEGIIEIYECEFELPGDFGTVGAVLIENEQHKEVHINKIEIQLPEGPVTFTCNSWVHSKFQNPAKRIFFSDKSYLPSETPDSLKKLRKSELENLRGENRQGEGEFKTFERIYDYDVYNDLGNPDSDPKSARPVLGGKQHPYPRRCKTGRKRCETDRLSEQRYGVFYVPRDEEFSEVKSLNFGGNTLASAIPAIIPQIESFFIDSEMDFPHFKAIDNLFEEGVQLPDKVNLINAIPRFLKTLADKGEDILQFESPSLINKDRFSWIRDEEFARQTLAGLNPYSIERVREWPLRSKLDPKIYGDADSLITTELVEKLIGGVMTVEEALEKNKLYILDYHDVFLPYVHKVRELEGTTLYGSRTLFFLNEDETLRPIAIELTRPLGLNLPQWRQVFTPGYDNTACWLWRLAKAHVVAHDSGFHQLIVHWLRTHCAMEPYIIAANRQLSAMHPIYRLLHPHFRYTMEINALARKQLINANGIIESCFWPKKYSMEISSAAYDKLWRFDMEALPADLIRRGMAIPDENEEHGVRLTIKDYPFANDGLILWDAIKQWVTDYVNHYYPEASLVEQDEELQQWWNEVRTIGHGDKKDEPWWPVLKTQSDLIQVVTTIAWVGSGHHAAVNFGQYGYGAYIPNRPTTARIKIPVEEPSEAQFKLFLDDPEKLLLRTFPSQSQSTQVMVVLDLLSCHSPDEEYIGESPEAAWSSDPVIFGAYERFKARLMDLEGVIDLRNADLELKNRSGAGVVKYELLKPWSEKGVTGKGVPYSVSI